MEIDMNSIIEKLKEGNERFASEGPRMGDISSMIRKDISNSLRMRFRKQLVKRLILLRPAV